jgi:WD40 repeat protein
MANLVKLELSKKQISFQPDNFRDFSRIAGLPEAGDFQVTVVNASDRFSSFQIELEVGSQRTGQGGQWYRVEPEICAKKPPGDRTVFTVTLLKSPVRSYDIEIPITVRVLSVEVAQLTAEDTLFLKVKRPQKTLHAYLPIEDLTVYPGDRCKIPVLIYNLHVTAREVTLRLKGLEPAWLPEGTEQTLHLDSGESGEAAFWCAPPAISRSRHQVYPLLLEAFDDNSNTASAQGTLAVLPFGQVVLDCARPQQTLPLPQNRWHQTNTAQFHLTFHNQSNLSVSIHLEDPHTQKRGRSLQVALPAPISLNPDTTESVQIQVQALCPWLGMGRTDVIDLASTLTWPGSGELIQQVPIQPSTQALKLKLLPRIPLLLQMIGGLLTLCLLALGWWLWPRQYHSAPVTALTLMANGSTVISGSSDQTLRTWQIHSESWLPDIRRLKSVGLLTKAPLGKSVRTLRHLPAEVNQLAVGLENGEVQIWDIASRSGIKRFFEASQPDRVFALNFTEDSRLLFTGHGSGQVRLWSMVGDSSKPIQRLYPTQQFAISALAVIEQPGRYKILAAGGQFNRLVLWLWEKRQAFNIDYSIGLKTPPNAAFAVVNSRQSYLTSFTAANTAAIMASADNQGFITLWDIDALYSCMAQRENSLALLQQTFLPPEAIAPHQRDAHGNFYDDIDVTESGCGAAVLDQWQAASGGQAVRSVALTENGCYLSSVGDDGRAVLWPLDQNHKRVPAQANGILLKQYPNAQLNTVGIYWVTAGDQEDTVLVAHDVPGNRVQLHRWQGGNNGCQ